MLYPRIIPVLLIKDKGLVKSVKFNDYKYVGDPLNAVRIFNEQEADELVVLDIDASTYNQPPNYKLIQNLASECRMPLTYGGGVSNLEQAKKILSLGVEKITLSTSLFSNNKIIQEISEQIGNQSVAAVLDIKKKFFGGYTCFTENGKRDQKVCPIEFSKKLQDSGAGEVIINSIDQDGAMSGYDIELIEKIKQVLTIPVTALGGAGSLDHMVDVLKKTRVSGLAAGSLFVFKGKYRAVLINYPNRDKLNKYFKEYCL